MNGSPALARHPLRKVLASDLVAEPGTFAASPGDYIRQFILGWLGGLVFFGTLIA